VGVAKSSQPAKLRALPTTQHEVVEVAVANGYNMESGKAFWHVQVQDNWCIHGRPIRDWHKALFAWCRSDAKRRVTRDKITNDEFWAFVRTEGISESVADDFIKCMQRQKWCLLNKRTQRYEPVVDLKAALRGFEQSDLNLIYENIGLR
jgi:hypothetical protein